MSDPAKAAALGRAWRTKDLAYWDDKIRAKVEEFGLSCFDQEFEICDHAQMLGYSSYSGMPAHYPHWSYGKAYEKLKTLYDHGVSGLPYEMVINANPSLAYLMRANTLCLQILTMAHVYGHNDFFKNNFMFRDTRPELTLSTFKTSAERVRSYIEDPSVGLAKVEETLDAAHALSLQCRRHTAIRKLSRSEQEERAKRSSQPASDPYRRLHKAAVKSEPDLQRVPLEPEEDLLIFIRDYAGQLDEWQRDLLTIVHEQTQYFLPQIETKIMNEGWASYWHHQILNSLELPQDLHFEFIVLHNQVVRPIPGQINPYHLGFRIWQEIYRRYDEATTEDVRENAELSKSGTAKLFEVREVDRDVSFLRRFLDFELMRELDLIRYERKGQDIVISDVSDQKHWREVKNTLLHSVGLGSIPVIRIEDADYNDSRILYLTHSHDGRDLDLEYAQKTLAYLHALWGRKVVLKTLLSKKESLLSFDESGFSSEEIAPG